MTNFSETPAGKKLIEKYVEIGEWAIRGIINSAFEQGKQAGREEISEKVRLIDDLIQKIKEKNDGEKDDTST